MLHSSIMSLMHWITYITHILYDNPGYITAVVILIVIYFQSKKSQIKVAESDVFCDKPSCHRCSRNTELVTQAKDIFYSLTSRRNLIRISEALDNPETLPSHPNYILHIKSLTSIPVWTYENLPETYKADYRLLKDNISVFVHDYVNFKSENNHSLATDGQNEDWSKIFFYNQGNFYEDVCYDACYKTYQVFTRCENLMQSCLFGYAFFSVLRPGTRIEKHCGPTNSRLRCHVSIDIPRDVSECSMNVCGAEVKWKDRGVVFFDDSLEHSVNYASNGGSAECAHPRNDNSSAVSKTDDSFSSSQTDRVVLLLDFWHPDLTFDERMCIQMCFPSDG